MRMKKINKKITHPLSPLIDIIALIFLILAIIASILPIPIGLILFIFGILIFGARFRKVINGVAKLFNFENNLIFKRLMKEESEIEKKIIKE
jgi:uncharacterized membrane protein